jgi:non-heme chloroperoxidase
MKKLETKYLDLPDIRIAYTEYGEGPILILLHGNSENKGIFRKYQTVYFKEYHTYALDSRGHGQSISNDTGYSIKQYSKDVTAFSNALNLTNTFLIGYSDGGNISLFLAKDAPEKFNKIVAISPNYLVSGTTDKTLKLFRNIYAVFKIFGKLGFNTQKWIWRLDLMLNDIGLTEKDLQSIKADMKILYAENDLIKENHIVGIHTLIESSTIKKIAHCTHLNILRQEETIQEIKEYLGSQ